MKALKNFLPLRLVITSNYFQRNYQNNKSFVSEAYNENISDVPLRRVKNKER